MTEKRDDPSTTSADYEAMTGYWSLVEAFQGGVEAMRAAGERYLPRFAGEGPPGVPGLPRGDDTAYEQRLKISRFTNLFGDICESLAARPFAEQCKLADGADDRYEALAKDIDGRGNSLHTFAAQTFHDGIRRAIDWILVDFTKATPVEGRPLSQAEEAAQGLRPYWRHVPATAMIAVYSDFVGGEEMITHARFRETVVERDRFAETVKNRIRVYDREPVMAGDRVVDYAPATWEVWEEVRDAVTQRVEWVLQDSGELTIGEIALVPFATGLRLGSSWQFIPPMKGAAELQVEHYQAENGLKWTTQMTAYPMLAGNGVVPEVVGGRAKPVPIGPRTALYAPPLGETGRHGDWAWIEPAGTSLTFVSGEVDKIEKRMRELGRQPLTADSGNLTVIAAAVAGQKGNSAAQNWALGLQAALERAWKLTAKWLKLDPAQAPAVEVYTDFGIELDDKGPETLTTMRAAGDLTRPTYWAEMRRRNILSPKFDAEAEQAGLDKEAADNIASQADMLAAAGLNPANSNAGGAAPKPGQPKQPAPKPGQATPPAKQAAS